MINLSNFTYTPQVYSVGLLGSADMEAFLLESCAQYTSYVNNYFFYVLMFLLGCLAQNIFNLLSEKAFFQRFRKFEGVHNVFFFAIIFRVLIFSWVELLRKNNHIEFMTIIGLILLIVILGVWNIINRIRGRKHEKTRM